MNGGYAYYSLIENKTEWLKGYFYETKHILKTISKIFPEAHKSSKKFKAKSGVDFNIEGSTQVTIMDTIENYILMLMCDFLKKQNLLKKNCVLLFDGVLLPENNRINADLLRKMEKNIYEKYKIEMKLRIKPIKIMLGL